MTGLLARLAQGGASAARRIDPPEIPMIAHHNTNLPGIIAADELGGIPMPSVAISRADAPMGEFGDISLLLRPDQVNPARGVNVFASDAYTGRQDKGFVNFTDPFEAREKMMKDPNFNHLIQSVNMSDFNTTDDMMAVAQYGVDKGIGDPKDFSTLQAYARHVRGIGKGRSDYNNSKMGYPGLAAYGDVKRFLAAKDPYTPMGNRRAPIELTLQEVMKRMRSDRAYNAGTEKFKGAGLLRAISAEQFKNMSQIKNNRGLLMPGDSPEMAATIDRWSRVSNNVVSALSNNHFNGNRAKAEEVIQDAAMGRGVSWADLTEDQNAAVREAVYRLRDQAKGLPTEYFEAKPKRIIELSDIDGAVVPEDTPEAAELLQNAGVKNVAKYNPDNRQSVMAGFKDFLFGVPALGTTGILGSLMGDRRERQ
jgi:hypothetical protein